MTVFKGRKPEANPNSHRNLTGVPVSEIRTLEKIKRRP